MLLPVSLRLYIHFIPKPKSPNSLSTQWTLTQTWSAVRCLLPEKASQKPWKDWRVPLFCFLKGTIPYICWILFISVSTPGYWKFPEARRMSYQILKLPRKGNSTWLTMYFGLRQTCALPFTSCTALDKLLKLKVEVIKAQPPGMETLFAVHNARNVLKDNKCLFNVLVVDHNWEKTHCSLLQP